MSAAAGERTTYRNALRQPTDEEHKRRNWDAFLRALDVHYEHIAAAKTRKALLNETPPTAPAIGDRPKGSAKVNYLFPLPEQASYYRQQLNDRYGWKAPLPDETAFRKRFAEEAKARGITREQVTGIYKFETGGKGTCDYKAHNSSAMGYVQMLAHNSLGSGLITRPIEAKQQGRLLIRNCEPVCRSGLICAASL